PPRPRACRHRRRTPPATPPRREHKRFAWDGTSSKSCAGLVLHGSRALGGFCIRAEESDSPRRRQRHLAGEGDHTTLVSAELKMPQRRMTLAIEVGREREPPFTQVGELEDLPVGSEVQRDEVALGARQAEIDEAI